MFGKIKFSFLPTILIICLFVISGNLSSVCAQINQNNSKTNESSSNIRVLELAYNPGSSVYGTAM